MRSDPDAYIFYNFEVLFRTLLSIAPVQFLCRQGDQSPEEGFPKDIEHAFESPRRVGESWTYTYENKVECVVQLVNALIECVRHLEHTF